MLISRYYSDITPKELKESMKNSANKLGSTEIPTCYWKFKLSESNKVKSS